MTLGWTAACAVVVSVALMAIGLWTFAHGGAAGQWVWLAPALWLAAPAERGQLIGNCGSPPFSR